MKYEFILKEKITPYSSWEKIGCIKQSEQYFDSQVAYYESVIQKRKKLNPGSDYILLINKLDDDGEFLEVVQ